MICRKCGTEIADKAIVCYRCGTGTTEPLRQPAAVQRRRSRLLPLVALVLLVLFGLYLGQAGQMVLPPDSRYGIAAEICIGVAIVVLIIRMARRRRR